MASPTGGPEAVIEEVAFGEDGDVAITHGRPRRLLRARQRAGDSTPTMLVYSLRGPRDLMYGPELEQLATASSAPGPGSPEVRLVYTRKTPDGHPRPAAHLTADDLKPPAAWPRPLASRVYLCGSSGFVDHATTLLREVGYPDDRIRTERFGATGTDR